MLPASLLSLLQEATAAIPPAQLAKAVEVLSGRYRAEQTGWHVSNDLAARAYLASRFPATFSALSAAFSQIEMPYPPRSLLDVGAGPATATLSALHHWDSLEQVHLLEGSASMQQWGQYLLSHMHPSLQSHWDKIDLHQPLQERGSYDLIILNYVLNEIPSQNERLIHELWERTAGVFLIVEPGTTTGWQRIIKARSLLLSKGAYLIAPCTHTAACPIQSPDWCHFSQRVSRSRVHRQSKNATLNYEDEKFIYLAVSPHPIKSAVSRVLMPPLSRSGLIQLKLCQEGKVQYQTVSKRDGVLFRQAKKLEWGDAFLSSSRE